MSWLIALAVCMYTMQGKFYTYYFSFMQYDQKGLTTEDLWFTVALLRTSRVQLVEGGVSALSRLVVKLFEPLKRGLLLTFRSGRRSFLFANMKVLVADEAALKSMWAVKGAAGTLPCLMCWNLVQQRGGLHLSDATGRLVPHTCTELNKILLRSDEDFRTAAMHLVAEKRIRTKKQFEILEQSMGINYVPTGMLFDEGLDLKPISHTMYDWLHIYLVNGLFQTQSNLMLEILSRNGCKHDDVAAFLKTFSAPKEQASNFKAAVQTFDKAKAKDAWKPAASEVLCVYPLIRLLVLETSFEDAVDKLAAKSFLILCRILGLLSEGGKGQQVDPAKLEQLILQHLDSFKSAHSSDDMQPKFHFSIHLPALLRRHKLLVSCWCHERKHKQLKMWANQIHNAGDWYETSVLKEVSHTCMRNLHDFCPKGVHLVKPKAVTGKIIRKMALDFLGGSGHDGIKVSAQATIHGMICHANDVVVVQIDSELHVGIVHVHVEYNDHPWSIVALWTPLGKNRFQVNDTIGRWVETSSLGPFI